MWTIGPRFVRGRLNVDEYVPARLETAKSYRSMSRGVARR
jgi:hypothetical protein